jgi:hypothetical protein
MKFILFTYRFVNFLIHAIAICCAVIFTTMFPVPFDAQLQRDAIKRGWPRPIVYFTRGFCHFTIISAVALCIHYSLHLFVGDEDPWWSTVRQGIFVVAHAFQTSVGFFYHLFMMMNPFYLIPQENFPNNPAFAIKQLFRFTKPEKRGYIPIWLMLHIQHVFAPLAIWFELFCFGTPENYVQDMLTLEEEIKLVVGCLIGYGILNLFSWLVRGIPPYPLQLKLWRKSRLGAIAFYIGFVVVTVLFTILARKARVMKILPKNPLQKLISS